MTVYRLIRMFQPSPGTGLAGIIIALIIMIGMFKLYEKAGEKAWAALVPIYNLYVLYKITWGQGWYFLLLLVPLLNLVIAVITAFRLSRAFGKGTGFGFGLLLLPCLFYPILGYGDARYQGVPR
jgi:hypothetical protein